MQKISFLLAASLFFTACVKDQNAVIQSVEAMEKDLKSKTETDPRLANQMVAEYEGYAQAFPNDTTRVADYLLKAGQVAVAVGNKEKAVALLEKSIKDYPNAKSSEKTMFILAFTQENTLKDLEKAKATYEAFLVKYPNSELADDARMAITMLGKSPEEIMKGFAK
jgi:outer membrane protein assembly factor BamD (BamD/ComL family)